MFQVRILDDGTKEKSIEQFTCDLRLGSGVSSLKTEDKEVTIEIQDSDGKLFKFISHHTL